MNSTGGWSVSDELREQPRKTACVHAQSLQLCLTLRDQMDCSLPGSSVHGILQARLLDRVAMPSSGGSFNPGIECPVSPALQENSLLLSYRGSPGREQFAQITGEDKGPLAEGMGYTKSPGPSVALPSGERECLWGRGGETGEAAWGLQHLDSVLLATGSCDFRLTSPLLVSTSEGSSEESKTFKGPGSELRLEVTQAAGQQYLGEPEGGLAGQPGEEKSFGLRGGL